METAGGATGDFGEEYEYDGRVELRDDDEREKLELRPELEERPGIFYFIYTILF